jgi:hypothetical protein
MSIKYRNAPEEDPVYRVETSSEIKVEIKNQSAQFIGGYL